MRTNRALHTALREAAMILLLLVLAIAFFGPVTVGGKTLLPADNAFAWQPWKSYAAQEGAQVPHNSLLSDLYLENYAWKRFIVQCLQQGQLPLWNPNILAGVPFLAAGQHSALYPPSILFYVLPLAAAYGWFAALHLFLAGAFTYAFARTRRLAHVASLLAAITFMFSGFMVIRNVFPMVVAAAVWLPLILTCLERIAQRAEEGNANLLAHLPDIFVGGLAFGMVFLAGHPEMYYYIGLTAVLYGLWRVVQLLRSRHSRTTALIATGAMAIIAAAGVGIGCAQWLPLLKLVRHNVRQAGTSLDQVLTWAYPLRRVVALLIPDFFGNPAHHGYWDIYSHQWISIRTNAAGQAIDNIYWGLKNYVEGAAYLGTLPILFAIVGALSRKLRESAFFIFLGVLSLLFAFGSRLYVVIYSLPGFNQVRTPFRWVYIYTFCVAILVGMGADSLLSKQHKAQATGHPWRQALTRQILPWGTIAAGALLLAGLVGALVWQSAAVRVGEKLLQMLAGASTAFPDAQAFVSYQWRNLAIFALTLSLTGLLLLASRNGKGRILWSVLAIVVTASELFVIGYPFFPKTRKELVTYSTPAIEFLQEDEELYRITSYVGGSEKTFNANAGMFYDVADVRGYDSIIPRQYAEYMELIHPQHELPFNRIAPINTEHPEALDSRLLDLLNVKYVLTNSERSIERPGYELVYDGEIRIYRNLDALPRAFLVPQAVTISDDAQRAEALERLNPKEVVILEEPLDEPLPEDSKGFSGEVESIRYTANEVELVVQTASPALLVLADSYFEGWLAFIRPPDVPDPSLAETELHIYRADGNFRTVRVPAGRHVIRFKYSPDEVKFGLYISFLSGIILLLGLGAWAWNRFYRQESSQVIVQRVTKNTVMPIALNLINKGIDMAFAMLMLRILGPADAGRYYFAVVVIGWFDILINFGLNTYLTREVARDKGHSNQHLCNALVLRSGLWVAAIPLMALFFGLRAVTKPLDHTTMLAIGLFGIGLLPSNISATFSALFNAHERMEIPAGVATITTLLKVSLGTIALFTGTGYIGLAVVSIGVNLITLVILYVQAQRHFELGATKISWAEQRRMLSQSWPLMINLLLATLFFKVAVLLLEWLLPDPRVVGWYSTAYRYIDAVGLIPAYFTLAIFPLMSRFAEQAPESLVRTYQLAIKLLTIIALPLACLVSTFSRELISILGGSQYLPHAAQILAVMIWYMPIGFINSVSQYVLIALDRQRFIMRAFLIALAFNLLSNLLLIEATGGMASAYVAIASELALFIPFAIGIRRHLAPLPWPRLLWKQTLSMLPMLGLMLFLPHHRAWLVVLGGLPLYVAGLYLLKAFDPHEKRHLQQILPIEAWRNRISKTLARENGRQDNRRPKNCFKD